MEATQFFLQSHQQEAGTAAQIWALPQAVALAVVAAGQATPPPLLPVQVHLGKVTTAVPGIQALARMAVAAAVAALVQ